MQSTVVREENSSQNLFTCPHCGYVWKPRVNPPNYCAKCCMPLSERAKKIVYENAKKAAVKKIVDVEKFRQMWLSGESYTRIEEEFGLTKPDVYYATVAFNLPRRGGGFHTGWLSKRRMEENEWRVIKFLRDGGGYCLYREATEKLSVAAIRRLLYKRQIFKVSLSLRRSPSRHRKKIHHEIFKEEYVPKTSPGEGIRTFLCLGRMGVVRLMQRVLKKPRDEHVQKALTIFLRRYLTEAERVAVMWHLGVHKIHLRKQSIRIPSATVQPTVQSTT